LATQSSSPRFPYGSSSSSSAPGHGALPPDGFFKIEDTFAAIWIGSFIVSGRAVPEVMYLLFPMVHFALVLFSLVAVLGLSNYT
jgi:hypothetical protein